MSTTILSLLVALPIHVVSAEPGWHSDYGKALGVARREQRPLVVVLEDQSQYQQTASILANPMVRMTLRDCSVCRMDVNTRRGAAVADRLQATRFPYTVISDRTARQIVFRGSDELREKEWLALLTDVIGESQPVAEDNESEVERADERRADEDVKGTRRIVVVSTQGCHFCEQLKLETLPDENVQRILERGMSLEFANASEDDTLARQHGITIYPSILVLDQAGTLLDRIDGFVSPSELSARLQLWEVN